MIFIHDILGNDVMQKSVDELLYNTRNVHGLLLVLNMVNYYFISARHMILWENIKKQFD